MKFTLKAYQRDAVEQVLDNLDRAKVAFHRDDEVSSFSLTATTGAGKTVMAAAAIEALFYGSAEFDVEADPGAVVIWFSDDPALNLQTRDRLMEASEAFVSSDVIVIEPPFSKSSSSRGRSTSSAPASSARTRCSRAAIPRRPTTARSLGCNRRPTCRAGRSGRRSPTRSRTTTSPST